MGSEMCIRDRDAGSLFLVLAFFIVVILFVSRPFFNRTLAAQRLMQKKASSTMDHQRSALLAEQDRILQSLHELDADHATGKVLDEDYAHQRTSLLQAGADVPVSYTHLTLPTIYSV